MHYSSIHNKKQAVSCGQIAMRGDGSGDVEEDFIRNPGTKEFRNKTGPKTGFDSAD
jgi:hypothetical protein